MHRLAMALALAPRTVAGRPRPEIPVRHSQITARTVVLPVWPRPCW